LDVVDDILNEKPNETENWKDKKTSERKELNAMVDYMIAGIGSDSSVFMRYLETQSHFDRYSVTNTLLIQRQNKDAVQLKDFDGWSKEGVSIKKGEKAIKIFEPNGEYKTKSGKTRPNFDIKKVFDISQTSAENQEQKKTTFDAKILVRALMNDSPVEIKGVDNLENNLAAFYNHEEKTIYVRRGMSPQEIFRALAAELAHAEISLQNKEYNRNDAALSAYCVSFMLSKKVGIDVSSFRFDKAHESFIGKDEKYIKSKLTEMHDAVANIYSRMARELYEKAKPTKSVDQER